MSKSPDAYQQARQRAIDQLKSARQHDPEVAEIAEKIRAGDYRALSKGITLVESQTEEAAQHGQQLVSLLYPHSGNSLRIGITGVPGVGKSTFIESFGLQLIEEGHRVAVLAIDPSSQKSGGSILGDKTRMEELSMHPSAFIRPTPAADALGGVARATREAMVLCEAAGFDVLLIETVGVGQSETAVHSMTDFFLLLMLAGAGDELQGIKRGIMEMADAIAINKSEGENLRAAEKAKQAYQNALHLFPPAENGWIPQVFTCSALQKQGLSEIWNAIAQHQQKTTLNGHRALQRAEQAIFWFNQTLNEQWRRKLKNNKVVHERKITLESEVRKGTISPFEAAGELMALMD